MYLDVQVRLPNKFCARDLVDTVAMWFLRTIHVAIVK